MKIQNDEFGLFVQAGGYKCRPVTISNFKEGDEVVTHHFVGTIKAGVGKDNTCKKGRYLETWSTTGFDELMPKALQLKNIHWYKYQFWMQYRHAFGHINLTNEEKKNAESYMQEYIAGKHSS